MNHCPECGQGVDEEAAFCQKCGARLAGDVEEQGFGERDGPPPESQRESRPARQHLSQKAKVDEDSQEELLWEGGFSGKSMLGSWVLALVLSGVALTVALMLDFAYRWTVAMAVILLAWGVPLLRLAYRKLSVRYQVTTHRLFHQEGILRRTTNRVELIDVDDVTVQQSIFDRMMNVGTVRIESSDRTDPELFLVGIDAPLDVAEEIDKARRRERTRRGIHIEAV